MAVPVAHVVFTTHWDREWVQSFEQYRLRLVELVDNLLEICQAEPAIRFVFDGQTVVLEDYLEVRPDRRGALEALARAGRLVFGPWYVLADQFLQGPEATVRNLQIGLRLAEGFGGPMRHGYVPDSFGSVAALPAILNGFGIRSANFGRGKAHLTNLDAPLFRWGWKDGSEVLALSRGYANALGLAYPDIWRNIVDYGPDPAAAGPLARHWAQRDASTYPVPLYYWSVGVDHMEMRAGMSAVLEAIDADGAVKTLVSDPARYMAATDEAIRAEGIVLERVIGEMRGEGRAPMRLQGVLSTNLHVKQRNRAGEQLLAGVLEPLAAICQARGGASMVHILDHLWRLIIRNHPHDSVCACSRDEVIRDMLARYDAVDEQGMLLAERLMRRLVGAEGGTPDPTTFRPALTLLNTAPGRGVWPFESLVRMPCRLDDDAYALLDSAGRRVGRAVVKARKNQDLETFYALNADVPKLLSKEPPPDREPGQVYTILAAEGVADFGPAAGFSTLTLAPEPAEPPPATEFVATEHSLANSRVELTFAPDGSFSLRDKADGAVWTRLGWFENTADLGNTYDYKPLEGDRPLTTRDQGPAVMSLVDMGPDCASFEVTVSLKLPAASSTRGRAGRTRVHRLVSTYTLYRDSPCLHVRTRWENRATDHRLRVGFACDRRGTLTTGAHFAAMERAWDGQGDAFSCRPILDYAHVATPAGGLALLTRGLYELEARSAGDGGELYLTLIRSIGHIGQGAGLNYPVTHAKEQGPREVQYALCPAGTVEQATRMAAAYTTPVLGEGHALDASAPVIDGLPGTLLELEGPGVVLSCLKPAADGQGLIFRLVNLHERPTTAQVRLGLPFGRVERVNLEEVTLPDLPAPRQTEGMAELVMGPCEIATLRFTPAR